MNAYVVYTSKTEDEMHEMFQGASGNAFYGLAPVQESIRVVLNNDKISVYCVPPDWKDTQPWTKLDTHVLRFGKPSLYCPDCDEELDRKFNENKGSCKSCGLHWKQDAIWREQ